MFILLTKKNIYYLLSFTDHLLFCNYLASYDDFSILTRENKVFY